MVLDKIEMDASCVGSEQKRKCDMSFEFGLDKSLGIDEQGFEYTDGKTKDDDEDNDDDDVDVTMQEEEDDAVVIPSNATNA